ncbi:MAG TPA: glycine--tRNA ligase [Candidatus Saccharimonadales bacterium]|nr:glycine--tRNA ligase [Candidatus Saccharimonadales bacterium]
MTNVSLDTIVGLCKRRGFIFQGSEIYGGLAGTWDYGPLGTALKRNIVNEWLKYYVDGWDDMYQVDTTIIMNPKVWQASGHIETFNDPLIEDVVTKKRYRLDHLLEENQIENVDSMSFDQMIQIVKSKNIKSPEGNELGSPALFNMMFKTHVGPIENEESITYLRPETAQGMFTNFKNIIDSFYPDIPFGIAQVGKAFRNEISPRDFIFRVRELEIMEFEYFVKPDEWEKYFDKWHACMLQWFEKLGLDKKKIKLHEVPAEDRAHYSKRTIDFYYDFPSLGFNEISGLAYRTDFDLKNHQKKSGKNLEYRPKDGGDPFIPHVIEPTFGLDRHVMAVISDAYTEDEINGEKRAFLKLPPHLAPIKIAVSPLLKNKPELVDMANKVYELVKKKFGSVMYDDNGNIGKRYRRQDEIGTPYCITIDFDSLTDETVTVRERDTTKQKRVNINELSKSLNF